MQQEKKEKIRIVSLGSLISHSSHTLLLIALFLFCVLPGAASCPIFDLFHLSPLTGKTAS